MINVYNDVDGVLAAWTNHTISPPPAEATGWGRWSKLDMAGSYPGYVSAELIEQMNRLAGLPGVTMKFLTSWEEQAATDFAPAFGLTGEDWPVLTGVEYDDIRNWDWWKLHRIKADVAADRPEKVIWLDDDITSDPKSLMWIDGLHAPILHISPKTAHGLTSADMEAIFTFAGA